MVIIQKFPSLLEKDEIKKSKIKNKNDKLKYKNLSVARLISQKSKEVIKAYAWS